MSLEKIEQYVKELEAIKHYDHLKAENKRLAVRVKELMQEVSRLEKRVEEEKSSKINLEEELKSKLNELENLKSRFEKLELEASTLRETSKLVDEEKLTLPQLKELVAKVRSKEIKAEAEKLFKEYRSKWETEKKPSEVYTEACKALTEVIDTLRGPEPHYFLKGLVELGLPSKVEEIVSSEVRSRLDEELKRRVDEESSRKASEKLTELKRIEWLNWYASNVEPKIAQLEASARLNALNLLKGPWTITCDKCGLSFQMELTAEGLGNLLSSKYLEIECRNPTWRHKTRISLKDLIEKQITSTV